MQYRGYETLIFVRIRIGENMIVPLQTIIRRNFLQFHSSSLVEVRTRINYMETVSSFQHRVCDEWATHNRLCNWPCNTSFSVRNKNDTKMLNEFLHAIQ